ncbi:MAG: stage III sporulation protein J, partial [Eubacterium sp.]|nr:stage III sporulation protein J [Eubacterium sp.]
GLGLYWIAGGVIRSFYQFILNKHFDKMDLNDIIEKNKEKAEAKRAKRAANIERMNQAAQINTRTLKGSSVSEEERNEILSKTDEYKANAKPGSLTARANMVKEFNERNTK